MTEEQIPKLSKKIEGIEVKIREESEERRLLEDKVIANKEEINALQAKMEDIQQQLHSNKVTKDLTNLKINTIEEMINENNEIIDAEKTKTKKVIKKIDSIEKKVRKISDEVKKSKNDDDDDDTNDDNNMKNNKKIQKNEENKNNTKKIDDDIEDIEDIRKDILDRDIEHEHETEMKCARKKIGLYPFEAWHIRQCYYGEDDIAKISDNELLIDPALHHVRCEAALVFLNLELQFAKDDIKVITANMARHPSSMILWIETSEIEVRKIYQRAA